MVNTIGKIFSVTSFGTSHGKAIGAIVDGCPANLQLTKEDIQKELNKRKPSQSKITTTRKEDDEVEILSGIFNGKTDGTPITGVVFNHNPQSKDYSYLKNIPRPSHGDYGWIKKYGNYDYNGGGRGSGRVTISHVIGGAIAKKLLLTKNIKVISHVKQIGNIKARNQSFEEIEKNVLKNPVRCGDLEASSAMEDLILKTKANKDSVGGVVETIAIGVPPGLGEPIFGKLDSDLAQILMSIGSVKGVEIGLGFDFKESFGSEVNDEFKIEDNKIITTSNNSGGISGGISNGMPIVIRIAIKPTPSIGKTQNTVNLESMKNEKIAITGRHDPCICPRVTSVAESSVAIVLADHGLRSNLIPKNNLEL